MLKGKNIIVETGHHNKAQEYLKDNSESIDYAIIKLVDEISNKAIYPTSSIRDNIIKAIGKVRKIELIKSDIEKQVAILELLENFYNEYSLMSKEKELEDVFVETLAFVYKSDDKNLQGFVEEIYADYFE